MFDFHMHSTVSFDGHDTPEKMVRAAQRKGLTAICFTDHVDDDVTGPMPSQRFTKEGYDAGYANLQGGDVALHFGMEFGLHRDNQGSLKEVLSWRDFDFVLGSIHYAEGVDVYYAPYWEDKTLFQAEQVYLEDTLACVQAHDDFDVLAHLTYISKPRIHPTHTPVQLEQHREVIAEIFRTLAQKGKGIEINTSGVDRCGAYLPSADMVRLFKDLGGKIITVGSDAHDDRRVGQYCHDAVHIAKDIFGYVCTFEKRRPVFHRV